MQRILRAFILVGEKIRGVQHGIAQILESCPMKLIGTALGDNVYLSARTTTELRCGHAGLYGKLLHCVGDAKIAEGRVDLRVDVAHTVQEEDVGLGTSPGHIEAPTLRSRR